MEKVHSYIEKAIAKKKKGSLFFPSDFRGIGTDVAVKQALSRLTKKGVIKRLAQGIYYIPKVDPVLGEVKPGADEVIYMVALKEKVKIKPAGAFALHQLGLTTQVPTKRVYITDGVDRQFSLGKLRVKFKRTTPKKLERKGKISSLVIQAVEELGVDNIDKVTASKMKTLLQKENPEILKHDLGITSIKVSDYIVKLMKEKI